MRIMVKTASIKPVLAWAQRGLFTGAIALLGYCGFVQFDTWTFQHDQGKALERLFHGGDAEKALVASASTSASAAARLVGLAPEIGPNGLLGRIEIPRLGVSVAVVEGTGKVTAAAGRWSTSMARHSPGQIGNVGIAAHRDTFFRPLRNIQNDDLITLATSRGEYRYRVVSTPCSKSR